MNNILIEFKNKLKQLDSDILMYRGISKNVLMSFDFNIISECDTQSIIDEIDNTFEDMELSTQLIAFLHDICNKDFPVSQIDDTKYFNIYSIANNYSNNDIKQYNHDVIGMIKFHLIPEAIKHINYINISSISESLGDITKLDSASLTTIDKDGKTIKYNFSAVNNKDKKIKNYIDTHLNNRQDVSKMSYVTDKLNHIITFLFIKDIDNILKMIEKPQKSIDNILKMKKTPQESIYNKFTSLFSEFQGVARFEIITANLNKIDGEVDTFIKSKIKELYDIAVKPASKEPESKSEDKTETVSPKVDSTVDKKVEPEVKDTGTPSITPKDETKIDLFKDGIIAETLQGLITFLDDGKESNKLKQTSSNLLNTIITNYKALESNTTQDGLVIFNENTLYITILETEGKTSTLALKITSLNDIKKQLKNIATLMLTAIKSISDITIIKLNNTVIKGEEVKQPESEKKDETTEVDTKDEKKDEPEDETEVKSEDEKKDEPENKNIPSFTVKKDDIIRLFKQIITRIPAFNIELYGGETDKPLFNDNVFFNILKSIISKTDGGDFITQIKLNNKILNFKNDGDKLDLFYIVESDKGSAKFGILPLIKSNILDNKAKDLIEKSKTAINGKVTSINFLDDTVNLLEIEDVVIPQEIIKIKAKFKQILFALKYFLCDNNELDKVKLEEDDKKDTLLLILHSIKSSTNGVKFNINGTIIDVKSPNSTNGDIVSVRLGNDNEVKLSIVDGKVKLLEKSIGDAILKGNIKSVTLSGDDKNNNLITLLSNITDLNSPVSSDLLSKLNGIIEGIKPQLINKSFNSVIEQLSEEIDEKNYTKIMKNNKILSDYNNIKQLVLGNILSDTINSCNNLTIKISNILIKLYDDNYLIFNKLYTKDENGNIKIPEGFTMQSSMFNIIYNSKKEIKRHNCFLYDDKNEKAVKFFNDNNFSNLIGYAVSIEGYLSELLQNFEVINKNKDIINLPYFSQDTFDFVIKSYFVNHITKNIDIQPLNKIVSDKDFQYYFKSYVIYNLNNDTTLSTRCKDILETPIDNKNIKINELLNLKWGGKFNLSEFNDGDIQDVNWNGAYIEFDKRTLKAMYDVIKEKFKGKYVNFVFENYLNTNSQFEIRDTDSSSAFNWLGESIGEHTKVGKYSKIAYVFSLMKVYKAKLQNLNATVGRTNLLTVLEYILSHKEIPEEVLLKLFSIDDKKAGGKDKKNLDNKTKDKTKDTTFGWQFGYIDNRMDDTIKQKVKKFVPISDKITGVEFQYEHTPIYNIGEGVNLSNLKKLQNSQINGRIWYINPVFYYGFLPVKNSNANVFVSTIAKKDKGAVMRFMNTLMSYKALQDGGTVKQDEGKNFVKLSTSREGQKHTSVEKKLIQKYFAYIENSFIEDIGYVKQNIKTSDSKSENISQKMANLVMDDESKNDILKKFILKTISFFTQRSFTMEDWTKKDILNIKPTQISYIRKETESLSETQIKTYISESETDFKLFKNYIEEKKSKKGVETAEDTQKTENKLGDLSNVNIAQIHKSLNKIIDTIQKVYFKDNQDEYANQIEVLIKFFNVLIEFLGKFLDGDNTQTIESIITEHFYSTICKPQGIMDLLGKDVFDFGILFAKLDASKRVLVIDKRIEKNSMVDKFDVRLYIDIQYVKGDLRLITSMMGALNQAGGYF